MKLSEITNYLESIAPLNYQEDYDNSGLIVGRPNDEITSALVSLDCTEQVIEEAISLHANLVISHHPIVFKGLKKFNGNSYIERVIEKAIKNNIAIYAIHTNLDHVFEGVNKMIARKIGICNPVILAPKMGMLRKLITYCPEASADQVRNALFDAGGGQIGNYSNCSFNSKGTGTFIGEPGSEPFVGTIGTLHMEPEIRIEVVFKKQDERKILMALFENHPYEEVAYDVYSLENALQNIGSGMIGTLEEPIDPQDFLKIIKDKMECKVIRHTQLPSRKIQRIAVCGGSGSFLLKQAIAAGADFLVTADFKYHEFFDAEQKIVIADIGHFETEQFTSDLLIEIINEKFSNFAVRKTEHSTNPINYFF